MSWKLSCPDWKDRIVERRSLIPELPLFEDEASRALRIFKRLRMPDVVGMPTNGEACGDWVFDFVRALFGAYDPELRRRMIREFFILIPKKNGKSSIAAALMVTALIVNRRPAAEGLLIAPTMKIADIAFNQAKGIIKADKELAKLFHLQAHKRTITHRMTDAQIMIKASDADVITGSKATYILIDETHVFAAKARAADIFIEIRGSLAARPDGFLMQITTQSKEPPAGVFKSELAVARDVRDGHVDLPVLPVLYELPNEIIEDGGWKNPETWGMVNPNMGRSVDEAFLRDELVKAEREGPEKLALLASQHFNVEIGLALRGDRWRGADYWLGAADTSLTLDTLLDRSEVVTIGIDGGGLDDLFGLAVIGRCKLTRDWLLWTHAWVDDSVLELRKDIADRLRDFERDGDLTIDTGRKIDIVQIANLVARIWETGLLPAKHGIGMDSAVIKELCDELASRGIPDELLNSVSQGWKLKSEIQGTERKLKNGTFWHCGSPMMAWCVGNAKIEPSGNAVMITKQFSGFAKIDPLIATFCAVNLMGENPEPSVRYLDVGRDREVICI
jgi:phage terminase large subunit-like protein